MKRIFVICMLLLTGFSATFAQDAKAILDKLATDSKNYKTIQGNFEYKLENKEANIFENSKGTFLIKGDKYFLSILGTETYFDGTNSYSYMKEVNEVTIQKPEKDSDDFLKPSNLFTIYQKGYTSHYVGKVLENGKNIHLIDLLPNNENVNYKKLVIKIEVKTNKLVAIQSIGKHGDNVTVYITKMQTNKQIPNSKFIFDKAKYPDVEIIDMR